jgi:tight adherence protein B
MMMTILCLASAALAAALVMQKPPGPYLRSRLASQSSNLATDGAGIIDSGARRRGSWTSLWIVVVLLALIIAVAYLAGARGAVITCGALMITATAVRLIMQYRRRRSALRAEAAVAQACTVLASYLRVGQVPAAALAIAAADCGVLRQADHARILGGDVVDVWRQQSRRPGHAGLRELARAWQISNDTGAPMSATLDQVAASLAADQALTRVVNSELAAARATGKVMAALPACGIGIGYLLGGDPARWLLAGPVGWACLLLGVLLACAGVLWIEALARHASGEG